MPTVDEIIEQATFRRNVYAMVPEGASRVLDIGCGDGALLLRLMRDKGCTDLHGVEMNADLTGPLAEHVTVWNVNVERDSDLFRERQGYFDHIILHDVVEHLFDPWHTLMRIRSLGSENCSFIIATPNLHYWRLQHQIMSGHFPYGPGLWHTGHLRWYTPASLLELLIIGGLMIKGLFLEIPEPVSKKRLNPAKAHRVQFPPEEFQQGVDPDHVITVEYPRSVHKYVPAFYAHKLIALCGKGDLLVEPGPMTYNCPMIEALRKSMNLPFDVYNPPHMTPLTGAWS